MKRSQTVQPVFTDRKNHLRKPKHIATVFAEKAAPADRKQKELDEGAEQFVKAADQFKK